VLAPSLMLATIGVLLTALITAPVAKYALDLNWTEAFLVGAVVASTDAAAVFLLVHTQGYGLRPRVGATLEAESGPTIPSRSSSPIMRARRPVPMMMPAKDAKKARPCAICAPPKITSAAVRDERRIAGPAAAPCGERQHDEAAADHALIAQGPPRGRNSIAICDRSFAPRNEFDQASG